MKKKIEFVLSCHSCSAGDGFKSKRDAEKAGWIDVGRDVTGFSWNDLGFCPDCQIKEQSNNAVALVRSAWSAIDPAERRCQKAWPKHTAEAKDAKKILKWAREAGRAMAIAKANKRKLEDWEALHRSA